MASSEDTSVSTASVLAGARVVVIGAGAVGTCAAYRLAQSGAQVMLVERNYPGGGTTGNSFAWLNAFGKFSRDYYRLRLDSIRAHRELESELNGRWLTLNGGLHWKSRSGRSQFDDVTDAVKRLRGWGARVDDYRPAELRRTVEFGLAIDEDDVDMVYVVENEGWLQPALMIQALLRRGVAEYGIQLATGSVVDLSHPDGGVAVVTLDSGAWLECDLVLVAAGPASAEVASLAGAALPVETSRGILAVTPPAPAPIQHVIIAPDISLRPDGGGRILATSEVLSSASADALPSAEMPEVEDLQRQLHALVPALRGVPFESYRKGVRVLPKDGYPIVGFDPDVPWLYYAVMHSGITLCAGIANHIVDDLVAPSDALALYRQQRFVPGHVAVGATGE
jgi:glycine/D-amino acid oxidase-like deaminating enzyme